MRDDLATDMLAGLLMEQAAAPSSQAPRVPVKVYVVMAVTSLLTFATLTTGYQLFFTTQLFA